MPEESLAVPAVDKIELRLPRPTGDLTISLRFPTDQEWIKRQQSRRVIQKTLGRGASETDVLGAEDADAALLSAITTDTNLQPGEASLIVNLLSMVFVSNVERDGTGYEVTIQTCGDIERKYVLKVPSAKQVMDYTRKRSRAIDLPWGQTEFRINIEAAAALFDELCELKTTSIIYKDAAIRAVVGEMERMMEPSKEGLRRASAS